LVRLALKEVKEITTSVLVEWNSVLVLPVQLCHGVLVDVLWQCDGTKRLEIVCMDWLKVGANISEKSFGIFSIGMADKLQEGIDKDRPKQFRQFELDLLEMQKQSQDRGLPCRYPSCSLPIHEEGQKLFGTSLGRD
jgi:hypothetical protein